MKNKLYLLSSIQKYRKILEFAYGDSFVNGDYNEIKKASAAQT